MKYIYLATACFMTTLCAIAAAMQESHPAIGMLGLVIISTGVMALACFGLYNLECVKNDMLSIGDCNE